MLPSKQTQRRVWDRVYAGRQPKIRPQDRQALRQCRMQTQQCLRFYESRRSDPTYGPAYEHLAGLMDQALAMLQRLS